MSLIRRVLDASAELLRGEPLRALGYGVAVVLFFVALAFDKVPDMTFDEALASATTALTGVVGFVETARRLVYSPPTVERIAAEAAFTGDPSIEPPPAK